MHSRWEKLKSIIKDTAEKVIGFKKKSPHHQISDKEFERMSAEQKQLRLKIENCDDPNKIKNLKRKRKGILKSMRKKVREINEQRALELVEEVENSKDDTRMFKAAKAFTHNTKRLNSFMIKISTVCPNLRKCRPSSRDTSKTTSTKNILQLSTSS